MKKTNGDFYYKKNRKGLGRHLIAEFYNCRDITSYKIIKKILKTAAESMGATVLRVGFHRFAPQGITAVALISESHISLHSWPEFKYLAVDIFTCGKKDPIFALKVLKKEFQPQKVEFKKIIRGNKLPSFRLCGGFAKKFFLEKKQERD